MLSVARLSFPRDPFNCTFDHDSISRPMEGMPLMGCSRHLYVPYPFLLLSFSCTRGEREFLESTQEDPTIAKIYSQATASNPNDVDDTHSWELLWSDREMALCLAYGDEFDIHAPIWI